MKKTIQISLTIMTIISCVNRSNKENGVDKTSFSDEMSPEAIVISKSQADTIVDDHLIINFPLDSLLSFDAEKELKKVFGKHVKRSVGYYPEGMGEYANTLLFPGSKNEVEFVWEDNTVNFNRLLYIKLSGKNTDWKTKEGITIGSDIKVLESLNKKPFVFYGLGWDYSGAIDWDGGYLDKRKISGSLAYPNDVIPNEFEGLLGDHKIKSSSELAQKARLVLDEIIMRKNK